MRLSRLEIFGFKSFAKKLDLKLTGGITAVVGPNGCGKTNVIDSIRWVLGEQKPSQMRLERMEEVIFSGSASRHPLGMTEVSLTIDNESGLLPLNMPEVTVTRRLFRSGESEYLLNKKPCRLADINDIIMDTGIGNDSYSIFELNMINAILSEKEDDRRLIFEEAAGVTKYKARRKTALNKLASIEDDLARAGDIIAEIERRVESLKRQASKASRYRELKSEMKNLMLALAGFELYRQRGKIVEIDRKLTEIRDSAESLKVRFSGGNAEYEELSVEIIDSEKELERITRVYGEYLDNVSGKEKELAQTEARLQYLGETAVKARQNSSMNSKMLEKIAEEHGRSAGNLSVVEKRLSELETLIGSKRDGYVDISGRVAEKNTERINTEKEMRRLENDYISKKTTVAQIQSKCDESARRLGEINRLYTETGKTIDGLEKEIASLDEKITAAGKELAAIENGITVSKEKLAADTESKKVLDEKIRVERGKYTSVRAERDFIGNVIKTYEGYSESVKNVMKNNVLENAAQGVIADMVSADEPYLKAVEAALKDHLQFVAVNSTGDALKGIKYLSENRFGRATFIALDGSSEINAQTPSIAGVSGVIGPAGDYIRADSRFLPTVKKLLAKTIIVDSLETAIHLQKTYSDYRFVTLNGEMAGCFGDIHGGEGKEDTRKTSIGRQERFVKLSALTKEIEEEISILQHDSGNLENQINLRYFVINKSTKEAEQVKSGIENLTNMQNKAAAKADAEKQTLKRLESEKNKLMTEAETAVSEKDNISKAVKAAQEAVFMAGEKISAISSELSGLRSESESFRAALGNLEIEQAGLSEKKSSLEREIKALNERRESLAESSRNTLTEMENAESESMALGENKRILVDSLGKLSKELAELKKAKEECEISHSQLRTRRSENERILQSIRREIDDLTRQESALSLAKSESEMAANNVVSKISDEYFVEENEIPNTYENDFDPEQTRLLLEDTKRKIQNIGDVNLAAENDYKTEKERLDFLQKERDDLVTASKSLRETINRINNIARMRFTETFDIIKENFKKMFGEFFKGGSCSIELEEGVDPLESAIKISARPPGKNVRSINLLSSGEKALTAISLLFAIYLVKPSPFCILDEVDAPLDDANIDRYLKVIREFSKRTQFFMITHNKKTMANADNLYGITMEEPGMSTLVSVQLSETDSLEKAPVVI